ncbi:DoxX family protein [Streptomyces humi]|uniref:DoxX family protein n=1 Tax=Streptomyces humi TaxID=1428620 RepID=UPI00069ABDCC|nr:DoxX family protein [Streptomyces humi]
MSQLSASRHLGGPAVSTQPKDKLVEKLPWVAGFSPGAVRFVGIVEFVGALGLILPGATGRSTTSASSGRRGAATQALIHTRA